MRRRKQHYINGAVSHRRTETDYMSVLLDAVPVEVAPFFSDTTETQTGHCRNCRDCRSRRQLRTSLHACRSSRSRTRERRAQSPTTVHSMGLPPSMWGLGGKT